MNPLIDIHNDAEFMEIHEKVRRLTLTSIERQYALFKAVTYVVQNEIPGDIVECGVYKGGSMFLAALRLRQLGADRKIWMYDRFQYGMTEPGPEDIPIAGVGADHFYKAGLGVPVSDVIGLFNNYRISNFTVVPGDVRETLKTGPLPEEIALLRLDTDWYDSTLAELEALYPLVSPRGVVFHDDLGHWMGSQKAVDDYFKGKFYPLHHRVDYSARVMVKP